MLPQSVLDEFLVIPPDTTDENEWNGGWNVLLTKYFPIDDGWVVKPQVGTIIPTRGRHLPLMYQARPPLRTREAVDFGILFKIERQRIPVMFVEIKPLPNINSLSARAEADSQMRQRFADFYDASLTIFTGISAFGHIVCKYELDKDADNRITPEAVQNSMNFVVDVAPKAHWDLDLTTAEGAARILNIFQEVKNVMLDEGACNCL